jgi:tetratricopeptide (TPR) repeat protein
MDWKDDEEYQAIDETGEKEQIAYARHLCEAFLKKHPDNGRIWVTLATHLCSLALYAEATAALDRAQPFVPDKNLHVVLSQRGHILHAQGFHTEAEQLFLRAHALKPKDATYLIFAANSAWQRGDLKRAEALFKRALSKKDGAIEEAHFNLGGILLAKRRYREAAQHYRRALELDPYYTIAQKRLEDVEMILNSGSA